MAAIDIDPGGLLSANRGPSRCVSFLIQPGACNRSNWQLEQPPKSRCHQKARRVQTDDDQVSANEQPSHDPHGEPSNNRRLRSRFEARTRGFASRMLVRYASIELAIVAGGENSSILGCT